MAMVIKWRLFLTLLLLNYDNVQSSQDIMKSMTSSFVKHLKNCQSEVSTSICLKLYFFLGPNVTECNRRLFNTTFDIAD